MYLMGQVYQMIVVNIWLKRREMEGQTESLVQSSSAIWSSLTALLKVVNNSLWSSFQSPGSMFHPLSHSFSENKFADESFFHLLIGSRISVTRGWRSHSLLSFCTSSVLWRKEWQPTPVFLSGEFHGQRSLAGHSPWGHKESDTAELLSTSLSFSPSLKCLY